MDYATIRFSENGYHPTSVQEIVGGLGVGKGVFYWYFSSKEELFIAILRDAQHDLRRSQQHALAEASTPIERLARGIRASVHWAADHRELKTLVAFAATDDRFKASVERGEQVLVEDAVRHVRAAVADGEIADVDPLVLTRAMFGVTTELTRCFLHGDDIPDPGVVDELADAAVKFCLGGLAGLSSLSASR